MCRWCHSSRVSFVITAAGVESPVTQFEQNTFCTCNNPNGWNCMWACNFLFVTDLSVCFRICVEILACLFCKDIDSTLYLWRLFKDVKRWVVFWDLMKKRNASVCTWNPPHSVLMMCPLFSVLVLWMNYRVYRFPSSLSICLTLSTPDSLKLVTVSVTQRCAAIL